MDFKDKIKIARQKLLLSQQDFAKELGVGYTTLNRWENGLRQPNYRGRRLFRELCEKQGIKFD